MISRRYAIQFVIVASLAMIYGSGCGTNKPKPEEAAPTIAPSTDNALKDEMGSSDDGKAMGLQTVHFAFDSFALDSNSKGILKSNADILKSHSGVKVQIEGHTDARG